MTTSAAASMKGKGPPSRYGYMFGHSGGSLLLASLNDVPFYRCTPEEPNRTRSGVADHLLVPGENVFTLEVTTVVPWCFLHAEIYPTRDRDHPVLQCEWPSLLKEVPEDRRYLPYIHSQFFFVGDLGTEPAFARAPASDHDLSQDDELWEAVRRFHGAFMDRDVDRIVGEGSLKIAEFARIYPDERGFSEEGTRETFRAFFAKPTVTRPLSRDQLRVRRCAGGRAAFITRRDGKPAIEVRSADGGSLSRDLWFTRHGGKWRLFR